MDGVPGARPEGNSDSLFWGTVAGESAFPIASRWRQSFQIRDHTLGSKSCLSLKTKLSPFLPLSKTTYYGEKEKWQLVGESFKLWERVRSLVNLKEDTFTSLESWGSSFQVSFIQHQYPLGSMGWHTQPGEGIESVGGHCQECVLWNEAYLGKDSSSAPY